MKKVAIYLTVFFIFSFAGCAKTVKELKENPAGKYSFSTNQNYKKVYSKSATYLDNSIIAGTIQSRIDLYKKEAQLSKITQPSSPFRNVYLVREIEAKSKNVTHVNIYYFM